MEKTYKLVDVSVSIVTGLNDPEVIYHNITEKELPILKGELNLASIYHEVQDWDMLKTLSKFRDTPYMYLTNLCKYVKNNNIVILEEFKF